MKAASKSITPRQKRVLTTIRRHGVGCYRAWGKSAWAPRQRRKRR